MKTQRTHSTPIKECDFCHAEEGKNRLVGNFIVKLQEVTLDGQTKQACQSCIHKHRGILKASKQEQNEHHPHYFFSISQLKEFAAAVLHLGIMVIALTNVVMAQPPGLPGSPDQAPIDGGLGLLIAAGGVYAYKKLREKD